MTLTLYTSRILSSLPDTDSTTKDGIYVTAAEKEEKWCGLVYLVKGGYIHTILLESEYNFKSKVDAVIYMKDAVARTREMVAHED